MDTIQYIYNESVIMIVIITILRNVLVTYASVLLMFKEI